MRSYFFIIFLASFLSSCNLNNSTSRTDNQSETAQKAVIGYSETYFKDKLKNARIFIDEDGLITISNELAGYKINQPKIMTGLIDDDKNDDAVVPFYTLRGQTVTGYYHMIMLNSADTFKVVKTMNDIFNIHGIKNREIIAEVSTVSPDSPGYGCAECKEVVKYRYSNGDLVKAE